MAARGQGLFSLYIYIENFKNLLVRNHWTDFTITWQKCFLGDSLPRLFKSSWFIKKHGLQGAGLIFLYIYIENFKNLLVENHWTDFNITWQEFSFCNPLPRLSWFVKKHGCQGGGGGGGAGAKLIFLYIYIENFKNLLVRNHWTDFSITWQKCFLGDSPSRLFKPSWFLKKHDH